MQFQINTDKNITGHKAMTKSVKEILEYVLVHFVDQITRLEVHISDENSSSKSGTVDKRCLLEARLVGREPTTVSARALTVEQSVNSAAHKMASLLESKSGKLAKH